MNLFSTKLKEAIKNGAKVAAKALIDRLKLGKRSPSGKWTIEETVDWLVPMALAGKSVRCPCCDQTVHVYYRHLNGPMAQILCHMYAYDQQHPGEWMHVDDYLRERGIQNSRYHSLMLFWKLTEHCEEKREDQNPRSGLWRITETGREFVRGEFDYPKAFWMYNKENFGFSDEYRGIRGALRSGNFLYPEIMRPLFPELQVEYDEADLRYIQERAARVEAREKQQEAKKGKEPVAA